MCRWRPAGGFLKRKYGAEMPAILRQGKREGGVTKSVRPRRF